MVIKKAVCMHEEDAGILFKHMECAPALVLVASLCALSLAHLLQQIVSSVSLQDALRAPSLP